MLKPHPAILRDLVKQYEELRARNTERSSSETRRRTEDLSYTLCVSTGTRTVEAALAFAADQLAADLAELAYAPDAPAPMRLAN
ncbi:DUF5133 domain-containing protein [Streptomyces lydicus]|uniref:DUF5133 domain-containing protein n=1 Tax=Streptomyces lydicus TaxID=47763 RepID=A0A1D7VLC2_9ACTN|nr:DUF5133 domain-containing protein [Streptomyces lydicus]AOP47564.1 hypothetical protein SL103_15990 [Streptomyces lydicus]